MAQNLRAVLAQRLLPAKNGLGRILAVEYMLVSARIRELMLDPIKVGEISRLMQGDQITKGVLSNRILSDSLDDVAKPFESW